MSETIKKIKKTLAEARELKIVNWNTKTIEFLLSEIDRQHDTFYNEVRFIDQQLESQKIENSSLITTIESLQGELKAADDHEETLKHAFHVRQNINEKELYDKNKIIESQKEEIESKTALIAAGINIESIYREERDEARSDLDNAKIQIESLKAITELAVQTLNDVINEDFTFPPGRSRFIRDRLLEIERLGGDQN